MAKLDVHVHGLLSKSLSFDLGDFHRMVAQARTRGLDGFALTEHFHAPAFWSIHEALGQCYRYQDGAYEMGDGFRVLSGAEMDIAEGGHIGVIGPLDVLREMETRLPPTLAEHRFPTFRELRDAVANLPLTLIANHMLRPGKRLDVLGLEQLATFAAFELNGKDDAVSDELAVRTYAQTLAKPLVGGSDAHVWAQVGVRTTSIPGELSLASFRAALESSQTSVDAAPDRLHLIRICAMYKQIAKARRSSDGGRHVIPLPAARARETTAAA